MDHISGPDHSTLPTHQTGTLSRRRLLAGAAGGVAVVAAGQPAWAADATRPGAVRGPALRQRDNQVVRRIRPARALRDLRVLSEQIGPRIGGTASERAAAEYALTSFRSAGCRDVRLEPFPVADKFLADIGDPDNQLEDGICWQAGASPDAGLDASPVTGRVVDVKAASAPTWPADPAAVTGAVLLADDVQNADPVARVNQRAAFVLDAQQRGAAAVVLLPADLEYPRRASASSPRLVPTTGSTPPPWTPVATIPVLGVAQVQKRLLREDLSVRPLRLTIGTTSHRGLTSNNVFADIPGRQGANGSVVYVSGHYDSVIGAPGANDDGSGTVLTLELARVLSKLPKPDATIRLALWGSEEQGLIGSRHHVSQLAADPARPDPRRLPERHGRHQLEPGDPLLAAVLLGHRQRHDRPDPRQRPPGSATSRRSHRSPHAARATTSPSRRWVSPRRTSPGAARRRPRSSSRRTTPPRTRSSATSAWTGSR